MNDVIVYKRVVARKLLQEGFLIVDVQANNSRPKETVFFFKDENNIRQRIKELASWDSKQD